MNSIKVILLAICFGSSMAVHAKDLNPNPASFGNWKDASGELVDEFRISKDGFHWIAESPKNCHAQKVKWVWGRDLLRGIHESITNEFTEKAQVAQALKLIQTNKKYYQIQGGNKCVDGFSSFTLLNQNHALSMISGPEDAYFDLKK